MKVIFLENVLVKGQRYKAGASLDLDAETAEKFERAGVAIIEAAPKIAPPAAPKEVPNIPKAEPIASEPIETAPELSPVKRKASPTGKKASAPKKSVRGQK
jgi:hypothetical protein